MKTWSYFYVVERQNITSIKRYTRDARLNYINKSLMKGGLCTSNETSESRWISRDRVLDYIIVPNLVERFKAYLNFQGDIKYLEYITKPEYNLKLDRLI